MPMNKVTLPPGFEDLAPFTIPWGQTDSQEELYLLRQRATMEELQHYYDTVAPRLPAVFEHLDRFPLDAMPPSETLLFRTVCGLAEAAQAVETFGEPGVPYAPRPHHVGMVWRDYSRTGT